jgi:hypothetical protein
LTIRPRRAFIQKSTRLLYNAPVAPKMVPTPPQVMIKTAPLVFLPLRLQRLLPEQRHKGRLPRTGL